MGSSSPNKVVQRSMEATQKTMGYLSRKKQQMQEEKQSKQKQQLMELLQRNKDLFVSGVNRVKYAFVTFKSIEAQDEVMKLFEDKGCCRFGICGRA